MSDYKVSEATRKYLESEEKKEEKIPDFFLLDEPTIPDVAIEFRSSEGNIFSTSMKNAIISNVIKSATLQGEEYTVPTEPFLVDYDDVCTGYLIEYLEHQDGSDTKEIDPKKVNTVRNHIRYCASQWHVDFIEKVISTKYLLQLLAIAHKYDILGLQSHCSAMLVTHFIKGKSKKQQFQLLSNQFRAYSKHMLTPIPDDLKTMIL